MKAIIGLGNPGIKYEYTRHNIGFMFLNEFINKKIGDGMVWLDETKFKSHVYRFENVLFVKPQTFMNRVGEAVSKIMNYYDINTNDLLIIHDDVDLKLGEIKMKKTSGSAGHHGVEDLFSALNANDFWRLRVGVGRPENNKFEVDDYVLQKFSQEELKQLEELFDKQVFELIDNFIDS